MMDFMLQAAKAYYRRGAPEGADPFFEHLPAGYSVHVQQVETLRGELLDTFSGHLRLAGKLLVRLPGRVVLLNLSNAAIDTQDCSGDWRFAEELHGGTVGFQLADLSTLRAFSPVCELAIERHGITVLDDVDKTVIRGTGWVVSHLGHQVTWVFLEPLRGYDEELATLITAIEPAGFEAWTAECDYYGLIGLEMEMYQSKPVMNLQGHTPVYDTASRIASTCISVARQNEPGILDDQDTEFLHDYRVSLRRTRSMLSLFRQVYGDEDCRKVKKELADIMKQTNRLRDLDVYLMQRSAFFGLVPESMYAGLETLFEIFEQERRDAFDQVCMLIDSDAYDQRMTDIVQRFSVSGSLARGSRANEPSLNYAQLSILKRYRKVSKIARSIRPDTPDETVHALRIECKKLRYLMEFFQPLLPAGPTKKLVKSLKGLQELLGEFNDCSVQRESLTKFIKEHPLRGRKGIMLAESVGALAATLYQKQLRARSDIDAALKGFANKQTHSDFKQLFVEGEPE